MQPAIPEWARVPRSAVQIDLQCSFFPKEAWSWEYRGITQAIKIGNALQQQLDLSDTFNFTTTTEPVSVWVMCPIYVILYV